MRWLALLGFLLAAPALGQPVREQRCTDLGIVGSGGNCLCSEPLDANEGTGRDETYDPTLTEGAGSSECSGGTFMNESRSGTTGTVDWVASSTPDAGVPDYGGTDPPDWVLMRDHSDGSYSCFGGDGSPEGPGRECLRFYITADSGLAHQCNHKLITVQGFHQDPGYVSGGGGSFNVFESEEPGEPAICASPPYNNFTTFSVSAETGGCTYGAGECDTSVGLAYDWQDCIDQWCRVEFCIGVGDEGGSLSAGGGPYWMDTYIQPLPASSFSETTSHVFLGATSQWADGGLGPQRPDSFCYNSELQGAGVRYISYLAQARWDTDTGQRIGAASEIEAVGDACTVTLDSLTPTNCDEGSCSEAVDVAASGTCDSGAEIWEVDCGQGAGFVEQDGTGITTDCSDATSCDAVDFCDYSAETAGTFNVQVRLSTSTSSADTDSATFTVNSVSSPTVTLGTITAKDPSETFAAVATISDIGTLTGCTFDVNGDGTLSTCDSSGEGPDVSLGTCNASTCTCNAAGLTSGSYTIAVSCTGSNGTDGDTTALTVNSNASDGVIWEDDFESYSTVAQAITAWGNGVNDGSASSLQADAPADSTGTQSIRLDTDGDGSSYLFHELTEDYEELYVRYYVKYQNGSSTTNQHAGMLLGGYEPSTGNPQGDAGLRGIDPSDGNRLLVTSSFEVDDQHPSPADLLDDYSNWIDMPGSFFESTCGNSGTEDCYYGRHHFLADSISIPTADWICVEYHLKLNDTLDGNDGELTLSIDDVEVQNFDTTEPVGAYDGNGNWVTGSGSTFAGFQWRANAQLGLNHVKIQNYNSTDWMQIDDLVVSTQPIGCLPAAPGSAGVTAQGVSGAGVIFQ